MGSVMEAAGLGLGIVVARKFGPQLPIRDPLMRGGALALAGAYFGKSQSGMMRGIAMGAAAQGVVDAAASAFPEMGLNGPDPTLAALTPAQVDELEQALLESGAVNGPTEDYQTQLAGADDMEDDGVGDLEDDPDGHGPVLAGDDDGDDMDGY